MGVKSARRGWVFGLFLLEFLIYESYVICEGKETWELTGHISENPARLAVSCAYEVNNSCLSEE